MIQQTELFQLVQLILRYTNEVVFTYMYNAMQCNAQYLHYSFMYGLCHITVLLSQCIEHSFYLSVYILTCILIIFIVSTKILRNIE